MIAESQDYDLRPFLGDRLYFQVVNGLFPNFLAGGTYQVNGVDYSYEGLQKLLSYYSYSRYMRQSSLRTTSIGIVEKSTNEAQRIGTPERTEENRRRQELETLIKREEDYTREYAVANGITIKGPEYRKGSIRVSRKSGEVAPEVCDDLTPPAPVDPGCVPEAPNDGNQYGRQNLGWTIIPTGDGTGDMLKAEYATGAIFGQVDNAATLDGLTPAEIEKFLGLPASNGQILASTIAGVRYWVDPASGNGDMLKSEYATNGNPGVVDDSENLGGQPASFYATQTDLDGKLDSVQPGTNITIDNTDPNNPVINATASGGIPEAPEDGEPYSRKDGAWTAAPSVGFVNTIATNLSNHEQDFLNPHQVTAAQVGADPTGSAAAVQTNLDTHESDLANPHQVTQSQVGLGNVDNTSDLDKPVSTATQTELDSKLDSIQAGTNISVDNTDPNNPIISAVGAGGSGDMVWKGPWEAGSYDPKDVVTNQSAAFVAKVNTAVEPTVEFGTDFTWGYNQPTYYGSGTETGQLFVGTHKTMPNTLEGEQYRIYPGAADLKQEFYIYDVSDPLNKILLQSKVLYPVSAGQFYEFGLNQAMYSSGMTVEFVMRTEGVDDSLARFDSTWTINYATDVYSSVGQFATGSFSGGSYGSVVAKITKLDNGGIDRSAGISAMVTGDNFYVNDPSDPENRIVYTLTADPVLNGDHYELQADVQCNIGYIFDFDMGASAPGQVIGYDRTTVITPYVKTDFTWYDGFTQGMFGSTLDNAGSNLSPTAYGTDFLSKAITVSFGWDLLATTNAPSASIGEAPEDGTPYSRQDADWVSAPTKAAVDQNTADITTLEGSKLDSVQAGTNVTIDNTDPNNPIINSTGSGGGIPEAPNDGNQYGRQSESWTIISGGGGSGGSTQPVNQVNHGFSVNDMVFFDGTNWLHADKDFLREADSMVVSVEGPDDFTIGTDNYFDWTKNFLIPGTTYYLGTTGDVVDADPIFNSQYVMKAIGTNRIVLDLRRMWPDSTFGGLVPPAASMDMTITISSIGQSVTLPTTPGFTYNATVFWGDDSSSSVNSPGDPGATHEYSTTGDKTISITGQWSYFDTAAVPSFNDVLKVFAGFGSVSVTYFRFQNCNLVNTITLDGAPPLLPNSSSLFGNNPLLTNIDTSGLTTVGVTNMSSMFFEAEIPSFDFSAWDTTIVSNYNSFMEGNTAITTFDFSNHITPACTDVASMLEGCTSLTDIDLSGSNLSNVTTYSDMLKNVGNLTLLNMAGVTLGSVVSTMDSGLVGPCTTIDFTGGTVRTTIDMFRGMFLANNIAPVTNVEIDTLIVDNMTISSCPSLVQMFRNSNTDTPGITVIEANNLVGMNLVTNITGMFSNQHTLTAINGIDTWDITSNVTAMTSVFAECSSLNNLDLSGWDVSGATTLGNMFAGCASLSNLDISTWDTSNKTSMQSMFAGCTALTTVDLSSFSAEACTNMSQMFTDVPLDLDSYDAFLIAITGWSGGSATKTVQPNVTLDANLAKYTPAAQDAHDWLTGSNGWTINDAGLQTISPEAAAVISKMTSPSEAFKNAIIAYVDAEVANGNWALTGSVFALNADTVGNSYVDWVGSNIASIDSGSPTLIPYIGTQFVSGNSDIISCNISPAGIANWTSTSALMSATITSNGSSIYSAIGNEVGDNWLMKYGINSMNSRVNNYVGQQIPNTGSAPTKATLTGAMTPSSLDNYYNGILSGSSAAGVNTPSSSNLRIGVREINDQLFTGTIHFIVMGGADGFDHAANRTNVSNFIAAMEAAAP